MFYGIVDWFRADYGYGFIRPDTGQTPVFAHFSAIPGRGFRCLKRGQRVAYEVAAGHKGIHATVINVLPGDPLEGTKD